MVRNSFCYLLLGFLLLIPGYCFSLGLGEIEVSSALDQPLQARINLIAARTEKLEEMRVKLASADVFERVGVTRTYFLTQLKFEPVSLSNGHIAIHITSKEPVHEPFLTFLVEVTWPKGRLLREYTVLLDPPEFAQQQASQVLAPVVTPASAEEDIDHPEPVVATDTQVTEVVGAELTTKELEHEVVLKTVRENAMAVKHGSSQQEAKETKTMEATNVEPEPEIGSAVVADNEHTIVKGDTLSEIARITRDSDGITINQMMLAIQQANPDAFIENNINLLKIGTVLRITNKAYAHAHAVSKTQAAVQVAHQNALWREYQAQISEKIVATNVDMPNLIAEENGSDSGLVSEAKEALQETIKKAAHPQQDLNIMADENSKQQLGTGSAQLAGGEDLQKAKKELALSKELMQSRENENQDLKTRVEALESMLEKKDKIINIQSQQLNDLKQQLNSETNKAVEAEKLPQEKSADEVPAESKLEIPVPQTRTQEINPPVIELSSDFDKLLQTEQTFPIPKLEILPDQDSFPEVVSETKLAMEPKQPKPTPVVTETGTIAIVMDYFDPLEDHIGKGALVFAVLAVLGSLYLWRQKQSVKKMEAIGLDRISDELESDQFGGIFYETVATPQDVLAQSSEATEKVLFNKEPMASFDTQVEVEELSTTKGTGANDILEKAGLYMSYGLHQQAKDLLTNAIATDPTQNNYIVKLVEVFYSLKDQVALEQYAQSVKGQLGELSREWQSIVTMGKEIVPDSALFIGDKPVVSESFKDGLALAENKTMETNETPEILDFDTKDLDDELKDQVGMDTDIKEAAMGVYKTTGLQKDAKAIDELFKAKELEEMGMQTTIDDLKPPDISEEQSDDAVTSVLNDPDQEDTIEQFEADNNDTEFLEPAEAAVAKTETGLHELGPPFLIEDVGIKLDLAKVFFDMGDPDAARETLLEVINEGDDSQIKLAKDLMVKLAG